MMMMGIKNYYIGTPLPRFEYMKMLLSRFPEEIIQKYNLAPFGYYPARHTPGIWLHKTRPISFTLVVDDFAAN
jgi:hypothetical protein